MFAPQLFNGQVALVTGGRSGIGYAIAEQLLQLGASVMICARKEAPLREAAERLSAHGPCAWQVCDIRDTDQIQALADAIHERFGRLDLLVNNAGGQFPALAEYINDKGWQAVINNNLNGTFFMTRDMATRFFIPQRSGVVVNIIVTVLRGFPGAAHTGAARAGVENLTKSLAQEWSRFGIRLNCVAPGIIESSGLDSYPQQFRDFFDQARASIPMGHFGSVQDISNAVCFLASPGASYISGTTLYVDGAQHLNYDQLGLVNVISGMMGQ